MSPTRTTLAAAAVVVAAAVLVSGGSESDPRTPPALPGNPPPFLGTAVLGSGEAVASIDAYGDVVDLRPGPAGAPLIANPADRQAAGSVPADTGIVPWVRVAGSWLPPWQADRVDQTDVRGTGLATRLAYRRGVSLRITDTVSAGLLARVLRLYSPRGPAGVALRANLPNRGRCERERRGPRVLALVCAVGDSPAVPGGRVLRQANATLAESTRAEGRWLARRRPLGAAAPAWARRLYARSLLVLRSLLDRRTGALAAGARDGWAYVWPRDAATAVLALAGAGYRPEARRIARFLGAVDLSAAARFDGDGDPVPGRGPQGDAAGWLRVAARATGLPGPSRPPGWRKRPDYQEGDPGDYLANALAADVSELSRHHRRESSDTPGGPGPGGIYRRFEIGHGLVRRAGDPASGLDSAAAWAVRPFPQPALYGAARRTMLRLVASSGRYGMTPGAGWHGGDDPWTAPTAWTAWSLAAVAREQRGAAASRDRRAALRLLAELRRAATPLGMLPERVDARTGVPTSTTPLAWSHAFAILALRELWPSPH